MVVERVRESVRSFQPRSGTLVRVVEISGVGLRENGDGAVVLIDENGHRTVHGSVLRGVADDQLLAASDTRTLLNVSVSDADADSAGLVCGGGATLLLSPISDLPVEAIQWLSDSEPVVLVTPADATGPDLAVSTKGHAGDLGSADLNDQAISTARQLIRSGSSTAEVHALNGTSLLLSAAIPTTQAIIVGSGPMAEAFRAQGELMGWQVQMTDDASVGTAFCATATPADAVLVLSHNPNVDTPVLAAALASPVGYIGAMGSRRTQAARAERLEALGHTDRSRINGPVGLDLGSRTPSETAVAMAAEFLAVRRGRPPASLSTHDGPIHA